MNKIKARQCPICGGSELKREVSSEKFEYKSETLTIPHYVTYKCGACGEEIVDKATLKESGKILKDFQRKVDNLLTGAEIRGIRRKLKLTQEQLADILGGGVKAFARYESGQICQSRAMDNLLRILDRYPNVLNVIQKDTSNKFTVTNVINLSEYQQKYRTQEDKFDTEELQNGTYF